MQFFKGTLHTPYRLLAFRPHPHAPHRCDVLLQTEWRGLSVCLFVCHTIERKRVDRSRFRSGKEPYSVGAIWRLRLNDPCVVAMRSYVRLLWPFAVMVFVAICTVPDTPHIDVAKCSRSTSSVVLVLEAPSQDTDVVDGYSVFYSTDQDRPLDAWVSTLSFITQPPIGERGAL